MKRYKVTLSKQAKKDLCLIPNRIRDSLFAWIKIVEKQGLLKARTILGYHDEPLSGGRKGQRSIRLNRSYRAFYITSDDSNTYIEILIVIEVNKHDY